MTPSSAIRPRRPAPLGPSTTKILLREAARTAHGPAHARQHSTCRQDTIMSPSILKSKQRTPYQRLQKEMPTHVSSTILIARLVTRLRAALQACQHTMLGMVMDVSIFRGNGYRSHLTFQIS